MIFGFVLIVVRLGVGFTLLVVRIVGWVFVLLLVALFFVLEELGGLVILL